MSIAGDMMTTMLIDSKASGRTTVTSGFAMLLAGETIWDLSIEDLTYRFTFSPTIGEPRAEHVRTVGKHAEVLVIGGAGSAGLAIHLPGIAILAGTPHNLSFFVSVLGEHPNAMRAISYSVSR